MKGGEKRRRRGSKQRVESRGEKSRERKVVNCCEMTSETGTRRGGVIKGEMKLGEVR